MLSKNRIYSLGFLTLFGFPAIGFALNFYFQDKAPLEIFVSTTPFGLQLVWGLTLGFIGGIAGLALLQTPVLKPTLNKYGYLIQSLHINFFQVIFLSFCAGVGEEILFRGSLQHWSGPIITSIVFVAIHGYLDPRDWRITIYGLFMTGFILAISYLYISVGLLCSISAHFAIDVVLLYFLSQKTFN